MLMADFSSLVTGRIAPAGQTFEHLVHSGRQYPLVNSISGCISVLTSPDGFSTLFGQAPTQSWQAMQWSEKCFRLCDPAGLRGIRLSLSSLPSLLSETLAAFTGRLPSARVPTASAPVRMKSLRSVSFPSCTLSSAAFCTRLHFGAKRNL